MTRSGRRPFVFAVTAALCLSAAVATAQFGRRGFGGFRASFASAKDFDGHFHFCRWVYQSALDGDGGNWNADWPRADINLSIRLSELTKADVSKDPTGEPNHLLIRFTNPEVFDCPFVMATEVGRAMITDQDARAMRLYLEKGGFLWVDDFWGDAAWEQWSREIARALPSNEYTIEDVPLSDPLFHSMIEVKKIPQVPGIGFWRAYGGRNTSERGEESAVAHLRAIRDTHGRIIVVMTHNTDVSNSWERETEDAQYFYQFSINGYALGIDVLLYALTH
jgi:hypothetical protein